MTGHDSHRGGGQGGRRGTRRAVVALAALAVVFFPTAASAQDEPLDLDEPFDSDEPFDLDEPYDESPGLEVDAGTSYRVDDGVDEVQVAIVVSLANTSDGRVFDEFELWTPGPIDRVEVTNGDRELAIEVEEDEWGWSLVRIALPEPLEVGDRTELSATHVLPAQPARSEEHTRVNDAYVGWLAYGHGDPGKSDILIDMPDRYQAWLTTTEPMFFDEGAGRFIIQLEDIADPIDATFPVALRDDDRLTTRTVEVSGRTVALKGWPGDTEWLDVVGETVELGVPALMEATGLPLPSDELTILEAADVYDVGYDGFYDPVLQTVEIGDFLDRLVLLHELAHVWVNGITVNDRWIYEGLAELYANRALAAIGEEPLPPEPIDTSAPGARPLNDWLPVNAVLGDPDQWATEWYGYPTSYAVMVEFEEVVGEDGLRSVLGALTDRDVTYPGDGEPERLAGIRDWRHLLDLAAEHGDENALVALFEEHVLTPEQADLLDARTEARTRLAQLDEAGEGWAPPLEIRERMQQWEFPEALGAMDRSPALLADAREIARRLEGRGVAATQVLERTYESANDLDDLADDLADLDDIATDLEAHRRVRSSRNPIAWLGVLGTPDPTGAVAAAVADGDLDAAEDALAAAEDVRARATTRGVATLAAATLLAATGIGSRRRVRALGGWRAARARRRRPRRPSDLRTLAPVPSWGARPAGARRLSRRTVVRAERLASPGRRLLAATVDAAALAFGLVGSTAVLLFFGPGANADPNAVTRGAGLGLLAWIVLLTAWQWRGAARLGQTIGRNLVGIQVVDRDDGLPVGHRRALLRFVVRLLGPIAFLLGPAWVLWDPMRRGWHDLAARSVVVYEASALPRSPAQHLLAAFRGRWPPGPPPAWWGGTQPPLTGREARSGESASA